MKQNTTTWKRGETFLFGTGYGRSSYVFEEMKGANLMAHPVEAPWQMFSFTPEQQKAITRDAKRSG